MQNTMTSTDDADKLRCRHSSGHRVLLTVYLDLEPTYGRPERGPSRRGDGLMRGG